MTHPDDRGRPADSFLSTKDAEIVHGPDVIAEKVSDALADADRFDVPDVKPPLSDALDTIENATSRGSDGQAGGSGEQDALAGKTAATDAAAGSAEKLGPDAEVRGS